MGRVLVVDDEAGIRDALEVLLSSRGHQVGTAATVEQARAYLAEQPVDLVVTDLRLGPEADGMDVLRAARRSRHVAEVIVMTAYGTREKAQTAVLEGASFYLEKGPHLATDLDVLAKQAITKRQLEAENEALRRQVMEQHGFSGIIGKSKEMREVMDIVHRVASLGATVLITGESGTGKERIARALHESGDRARGPFIPVNCGAIPENLMESELFGYRKGAFSGAEQDREGLFEAADGGTIFLDEVGELPIALQPKLLRVLQERTVKRVGAVEEKKIDVRVVAATNRDLESEVEAGRFREDLLFRLNVIPIDLPALRQRREDIPLLANAFLEKFSKTYSRTVNQIEPEAMQRLLYFHFPGNIRQLENVIERGVALANGNVLTLEQLPKEIRQADGSGPGPAVRVDDGGVFPEEGVDLEALIADFECRLMVQAMDKADGVKTKAAELLGLTFRQFRYKYSKYAGRPGLK